MKTRKMKDYISLGILVLLISHHTIFAQTIFPTGTTIYVPDEAHSSYILISDHSSVGNHPNAKIREEGADKFPDHIRLIDMNGNVIHIWKVTPYFNKRNRLLPNGSLVCVGPDKTITEYDWDGTVVWTHQGIGSVNDLRILPNNNRLLNAHEPMRVEFQKKVKDVEIAPWWGPEEEGRKKNN